MGILLVNLVLPGSGLVLRDRLAVGTLLLLAALLALVVVGTAGLIATPAFADELRLIAGGVYLLAALLAAGGWALWERRVTVDERALLETYRAAAAAYLRDEAAAIDHARRLCRRAPSLPGAWRLLELVATARGERALARSAAQRARRCDERLQG